jgi:hypothetical protein
VSGAGSEPPRISAALLAFHRANARRLRCAAYRDAWQRLWRWIARAARSFGDRQRHRSGTHPSRLRR